MIPIRWWIGLAVGVAALPVTYLADHPLAEALRFAGTPWVRGMMGCITWLGYGALDVAVALGVGLIERRLPRALRGAAAVAAAGIVGQLVKNVSCRARPGAAGAGAFLSSFPCFPAAYAQSSFPSGHAATAFALATLLSFWYPRWSVLWLVIASAVGWSRIVLGAHFPSDVLGGAALGVAVVLVVIRWWPAIVEDVRERGVRP